MYKIVSECRICRSEALRSYLDLGKQPLANSLNTNPEKYPLNVLFCEVCGLSQLSIVVNPDILYKDYPYHSSVSQTFKNHCRAMAREAKKYFRPIDPMVLDIAANDGCLLAEFSKEGCKVLGIDPAANLCQAAMSNGVPMIQGYWSSQTAALVQPMDIITATNVLAHVDDIKNFLIEIKEKLRAKTHGIFIAEFPYLPNLIEGNQFDTIYHEHLSYFLLTPLRRIFTECGLEIFRVDKFPIHGGSIRIYASPSSHHAIEYSVLEMVQEEENAGYLNFNTYLDFSNCVELEKTALKMILQDKSDQKVMGYGASAKGCNLFNICGIDREMLIAITDDTPAKQGKTIPGIGIPIVSSEYMDSIKPDFILLLAWNFAEELMQKTAHHRARGAKYILPIPEVKII